ncbi:MAG: type II toxin-antitoxin system RelE/ParE family toxin [Acidobacteriota bacterium]
MKLVIVPAALSELQDAAAFYTATADVELGLAFVSEFERAARSLLENPQSGAIFRGTCRRFLLRRFPYSIIYQLSREELRIIAVAHQRRRPAYWAGRR